jgi:sterol-4alpha-carboxylate 3-dehydrogenase (decarboxylating)
MSLDDATILITGGLGQVGIAISNRLTKHHPSAIIHVLDLDIPGAEDTKRNSKITYHAGDITNQAAVHEILSMVKPQVVFHTAGLVPQIAQRLGLDNEAGFTKINVEGTRILLEESKQIGSVKAFIYTSSADVVKGNSWQNLNGVTEETPIPEVFDAPYAKSKVSHSSLSTI